MGDDFNVDLDPAVFDVTASDANSKTQETSTFWQPVIAEWTQLGTSTGPATIQAASGVLVAFSDEEPTENCGFSIPEPFYYPGSGKIWARAIGPISRSTGVTFSLWQ